MGHRYTAPNRPNGSSFRFGVYGRFYLERQPYCDRLHGWPIPQYDRRQSDRLQAEIELARGIRLSASGERKYLSSTEWDRTQQRLAGMSEDSKSSSEIWLPHEQKAVEDYHAERLEQAQRWQETFSAVAAANQQANSLRTK